ncbi:hypothetical protein VIBNISFn118_800008 [Vibrio nigripulchritudo SFn118]|nr:hypothetical protein VIBNISFn118_800008 [Vibrio nigripulchritudo SFn118]
MQIPNLTDIDEIEITICGSQIQLLYYYLVTGLENEESRSNNREEN